MRRIFLVPGLVVLAAVSVSARGGTEAPVVHVYSHRHYETDQELFDRFSAATGIEVRVVQAGADELIRRLQAEGDGTPADLFITADAGRLFDAKQRGLLRPMGPSVDLERVPVALRDSERFWTAVTVRARVLAYHRDRVDPRDLSTYEALASEGRFNGRVAVRSSSNIYNVSLLASIIAHHGDETARAWAADMVDAFARPPQGNDRDQLRALAAGIADVAIVNTYYVGRMLTSSDPAERQVAEQVAVFFPNQEDRGTHINISGVGVTGAADNPAGAEALIQFLLRDESQREFAAANYEYPAIPSVEPSPVVAAWGDFSADTLPLEELGRNARRAVMIFDQAGWE